MWQLTEEDVGLGSQATQEWARQSRWMTIVSLVGGGLSKKNGGMHLV